MLRGAKRRAGRAICGGLVWGLAMLAAAGPARTQDANLCDVPGEYPDLIVGEITSPRRWGQSGGITAYSVRTDSCNVGTCQAEWLDDSDRHPVIAQNLFRLENGRFEQVGQAWLKHGFATFQETTCSEDCLPASDNSHLGVACSDAYSNSLNGRQDGMGPKFEVNPLSGAYPWPPTDLGMTGDVIYKRLQVHNSDLDPDLHPGAQYFVEVQYVAADESAGGHQNNSTSYRPAGIVESSPGVYDLQLLDETKREVPAILAWVAVDPAVRLTEVDADGRFHVGARVTDLGQGTWRYEYAVHNLTSHESARSFEVPLHGPAQIANVGFHDVDYHSGEPFDGTDWNAVHDTDAWTLTWSTATLQEDPNANALRWGTLYNFRFEAQHPPVIADARLGLFRGTLGYDHVPVSTLVPFACAASSSEEQLCADGLDDDCDRQTDCLDLDCCTIAACQDGIDEDGDLVADCDCNDADPDVWSRPGEARDLAADQQAGLTQLAWSAPIEPGADALTYAALRATSGSDFAAGATCLALPDPAQPSATDGQTPPADAAFYYLVGARNDCPAGYGEGSLGDDSTGAARAGPTCP